MNTKQNLKSRLLKLLKEDEEFRYAVAGLIGLEEILKRFDRHEERFISIEEEIKRLREDMNKLREDMNRGFEKYNREFIKLREDMNRGFELVNRHISALGARWEIMAEQAFREGLRGVLEKELGLKVEKWRAYDESGKVFGYLSEVEVDATIKDGKLILIEASSHMKASDILEFRRKAELYEEKTGRKPDRLIAVTPYIDEKALEASKKLGIEVYTKV